MHVAFEIIIWDGSGGIIALGPHSPVVQTLARPPRRRKMLSFPDGYPAAHISNIEVM